MSGAIGEPNAVAMLGFFVFIAASLGITYVAARRTRTTEDFYAAGRKVLDQLSSRLSEAGEEGGQRLQFAVRNITRGYDALEAEVKRLKEELAQARGQ